MCLGGVPKYLEKLDPRQSLEKNLNRLCFSSGGFFVEEYETLFKEQFRSLKVYESIVESLSRASASLSELARRVRVTKGGGFHEQVMNLVRAQFVREYVPVKLGGRRRSRTRLYKLADPFLIFYFRYIHPNRAIINRNRRGENLFRAIAGSSIQQYYGHAFERLCEDGMDAILERLDIHLGDIVEMGPFFQQLRGQQGGLQIDWMILRRDSVWTVLEFKHSASPQGRQVIHDVERKLERLDVPNGVSIEPALVSASGVTSAVERESFFNRVIEIAELVGP